MTCLYMCLCVLPLSCGAAAEFMLGRSRPICGSCMPAGQPGKTAQGFARTWWCDLRLVRGVTPLKQEDLAWTGMIEAQVLGLRIQGLKPLRENQIRGSIAIRGYVLTMLAGSGQSGAGRKGT